MRRVRLKSFDNVFFEFNSGRFFISRNGKDDPMVPVNQLGNICINIKDRHLNTLYLIIDALDMKYTVNDRVTFKIAKSGFISPSSIKIIPSPKTTVEDELLIFKYKCPKKVEGSNYRYKDKISVSNIIQLLKIAEFKCIYCACELDPNTWQLDHYYPKAVGGRNVIENLVPSCKKCNMMKGSMDGVHFIHHCKRVLINNKIKQLKFETT